MSELNNYLRAVENEILIDKVAYSLLNASPKQYAYLPRPTKWYRQLHQNKLFVILSPLVWIAWSLGGAVVFFLLEYVRFLKKSVSCKNRNALAKSKNIYAVALSTRAFDIINETTLGYEPEVWITLPWVPVNQRKGYNVPQVSVLELVSFSDQFKSFLLAVIAVYRMLFDSEMRPWSLQSYTAYRWFLVYASLKKLEGGSFIMAEHYDRWALLMDMIVAENKNSQLSVVQHGALASLTNEDAKASAEFSYDIINRLKAVSHLYVYDEKSENYFKKFILSPEASNSLNKVQYFKPTIDLSQIETNGKRAVLFVGHPLCEDLQIQVLRELNKSAQIKCYYKPHPLAKASEQVYQQGWEVIRETSFFPDVELLVSYPSTLVNEYANKGKEAVIHAINLPADNYSDVANDVKLKLSLKLS